LIPTSYLQEWSATAPWPDARQVEQDLIISRALCDLFSSPALAIDAFNTVWTELVARIEGDPWKLTSKVVDELRQKRHPNLLGGGSASPE